MIERPRPSILVDNFENPFEEMHSLKKEYINSVLKTENRYSNSEGANLSLYFDIKTQFPKCIVVQVLLIKYFKTDDGFENIVIKMMISDGISCILCIVPDVVYKALTYKEMKQLDIIGIYNFEVITLQNNQKVMVIKEPPQTLYRHVPEILGMPKEYHENIKYGFPKIDDSQLELSEKTIFENNYYTPERIDNDGFTPIKLKSVQQQFLENQSTCC